MRATSDPAGAPLLSIGNSKCGHRWSLLNASWGCSHISLILSLAIDLPRLDDKAKSEQAMGFPNVPCVPHQVILQKSEVESMMHSPGDYILLSADKYEIKVRLLSTVCCVFS